MMRKNKNITLVLLLGVLFIHNTFAQNPKGFIPDSCSYRVISQPSELTKISSLVYGNNYKYPFLLFDNTVLLLSNDEVTEPVAFTIPKEMNACEDLFISEGLLICKRENSTKSFDGKRVIDLFSMPNADFNIYPANSSHFYFVKHSSDSSFVYLFEYSTKRFSKLFDAPFLIDHFVGNGHECFITSGEVIYYVSDEICTIVEVADSKIQSIDFYSEGAFFSTEKACYYMGLPGKSYPFLLGNIKQVMLVDNRLYLLFNDGLLSVIDNADQYQVLLDAVINGENKKENEKH